MATKPKRICPKQGCRGLFNGHTCTVCGVWKRSDRHDKSPSARGYGHLHNKSRTVVFLRDGYVCQMCGRLCMPDGQPWERPHKDHIVPLSQGGTETMDNAQTLCGSCNSRKSQAERRR